MSNTFGNYFRVTTFGESHGKYMGCVVDGCPANLSLTEADIQIFLDKRKPGQNPLTSERKEQDQCEIVSGTYCEKTLGSPICILIKNTDMRPQDYNDIQKVFRPNHADYTYFKKYKLKQIPPGGGRASARETIGRVAAGAVAKIFVQSLYSSVQVSTHISRVYDETDQTSIEKIILKAKAEGDSVGGTILTTVNHLPAGFGEPVFGKLEAEFAKAMLSIPAAKFFESGDGLQATYRLGSENNDAFEINEDGTVCTKTNHSGGIQGGISNGMPVVFTIGFKPVSTIFKEQSTVSRDGENIIFKPNHGRHDPCVLPRACIIVEAMTWLVLAEMIKAERKNGYDS